MRDNRIVKRKTFTCTYHLQCHPYLFFKKPRKPRFSLCTDHQFSQILEPENSNMGKAQISNLKEKKNWFRNLNVKLLPSPQFYVFCLYAFFVYHSQKSVFFCVAILLYDFVYSWVEREPSDPLSSLSTQFLQGLLTLGQLQERNILSGNAMSAEQVYHMYVTHQKQFIDFLNYLLAIENSVFIEGLSSNYLSPSSWLWRCDSKKCRQHSR